VTRRLSQNSAMLNGIQNLKVRVSVCCIATRSSIAHMAFFGGLCLCPLPRYLRSVPRRGLFALILRTPSTWSSSVNLGHSAEDVIHDPWTELECECDSKATACSSCFPPYAARLDGCLSTRTCQRLHRDEAHDAHSHINHRDSPSSRVTRSHKTWRGVWGH
jgi:hypothetical protein